MHQRLFLELPLEGFGLLHQRQHLFYPTLILPIKQQRHSLSTS
jgi:hypothetical protein